MHVRRKILSGVGLAAIAGAAALAPLAPALSQPATARTPNLEGTWVTPDGTLFFAFMHRFKVGTPPSYSVSNYPTFHLSYGLWDWLSAGALYSTRTVVPGAYQELEVFAKERLLDEDADKPLSLSLKEALLVTAYSPDLELDVGRHFGRLGVLGTARWMTNYLYSGSPRVAAGLGLSYALTQYLTLSGDATLSPMDMANPIWGAGAQIQIPGTPHTLSLQATNAATDTLQGSSTASGAVRFGFDFTIPLSNGRQWLEIFRPAAPAAPPSPEPTAAPSTAPSAAPSPVSGSPSAAPSVAASAAPDLSAARAFFQAHCAACHGASGQGGFGPDLHNVEAKGDDFIKHRIRKGSPKGMPPFESSLSASELDNLVLYVKSL